MEYMPKDYSHLKGTLGFSDLLLENHFTLYKGYVANTNKLAALITDMLETGSESSPEFAELKRRFGFEFNGMRLHELYFENFGSTEELEEDSILAQELESSFGSLEKWATDFKATGKMRGIGWVILYKDAVNDKFFNQWINEHETGHLAGCVPLLVMDVFEHAFISDYGLKRADYIEAFFSSIDWKVVNGRLK